MPRRPSFRFYAKNVFLTYPQCPCPKELLLEKLQSLLELQCKPYYILVAKERHQDGNPHLHAMVQCTNKIQTTNPRFFDLLDSNGHTYHPNIEKLNSPTASRNYIIKDGDYVEHGEFSSRGRSPSKNRDNLWKGILAEAETEEQFFALCKDRCPTDYVIRYPQLKAFSRDHYKRETPPYTSPFNLFPLLPDEIKLWAEQNILFVSSKFAEYELCNNCRSSLYSEDDWIRVQLHKNELPDLYSNSPIFSDSDRTQSNGPSGQSPSTSKAHPEQERPPGPEASDDTTTSPEE